MNRCNALAALGLLVWASGCASWRCVPGPFEAEPGKRADSGQEETKKGPTTLLVWTVGKKDDKDKGDKDDAKKNGKKTEDDKTNKETEQEKGKQDANGEEKANGKEDEPKRIDPDRPHLPEASTTVGLGRAVLEAGYTYNTSGGFFPLHSFPETLLRVGMFADWFELRVAQNLFSQTTSDEFGGHSTAIGAEDLQLGVKLALTEQQKCLPESAVILQMTVPSGSKGFSANRVLPGIHYDCSWEVIKDLLSVETVVLADGTVDDRGHTFTMLGHGVTAAYNVTKNLEAFGELDSFYATGDSAAPQHYFVGGLVYFLTPNCEIDARAGIGLNAHADGFLAGSGCAIRY